MYPTGHWLGPVTGWAELGPAPKKYRKNKKNRKNKKSRKNKKIKNVYA
jgi:hypothetical protein